MSILADVNANWIERDGTVIDLPNLSAVIEKDGPWFVSTCPELGVASQGKTRTEAHRMLGEAVELWLQTASAAEIRRRLRQGARVRPLQLQHA
jgi:predicted RNase H-like HicB family nuclease